METCLYVLPVSPFSPCDAPGISRYPHAEGEPCKTYDFEAEEIVILLLYLFFLFFSGGWGKTKIKLTTIPRIFIHVSI